MDIDMLQSQIDHLKEEVCELKRELAEFKKSFEKPDLAIPWDTAPAWAKWAAMDEDGEWWWYEFEPLRHTSSWQLNGGTCRQFQAPLSIDWTESKRAKP